MNKNPHRINNYKKFETIPISYYYTNYISKIIRFSTNNRISEKMEIDSLGNEWWTYLIKINFTLDSSSDFYSYPLSLLSDSTGQWYVRWKDLPELGIEFEMEPIHSDIVMDLNILCKWIGDKLSKKLTRI